MRVALLTDGETIPAYAAVALERMVDETDATVSLVVTNDAPGDSAVDMIRKGLRKPRWLRIRGGQLLLSAVAGVPAYKRPRPIEGVAALDVAERATARPVDVDGFGQSLPSDVVDLICDRSAVVIRQGFGIITGDVLTRPEHGVLSFHHGDPRAYRGGPPGFWEFLHGREFAGMMLQRLSETLDAGDVIVYDEVDIADAHTWREVQRRQYRASEGFLARAIENIEDPDFEPLALEAGPVRTAPGWANYLRYFAKNTTGRLRSRHL